MMRRSRVMLLLVGMALGTQLGCQSWNGAPSKWSWRGQGYDSDVNALTKNLRPPGNERQFTGLDARARDIERNLGVR